MTGESTFLRSISREGIEISGVIEGLEGTDVWIVESAKIRYGS